VGATLHLSIQVPSSMYLVATIKRAFLVIDNKDISNLPT
jgi:hypothetical protein